jgi:dihydroorotate dehydrogenase electron transfer subunit
MIQQTVVILDNNAVAPGYYRIRLQCEAGFESARPGQFVTLHLLNDLWPLLRRPFSLHQLETVGETVRAVCLLYKVVGGFTQKLSRLRSGDSIDLLGPLGNGFLLPSGARRIFLAAGGIGVAPLRFLAQDLKERGMDMGQCHLFLGGRSQADLLCQEEFVRLGMHLHPATEDGSAGQQGLVTEPLTRAIDSQPPDILFGCGPTPMLRALAEMAKAHDFPCQLSLETLMACGLGACLGCALKTEESETFYQHVCADGPVFDGRKLRF